MAIKVSRLLTKPSTIDVDMAAWIQTLLPITTVYSVGYIGTNVLRAGEPEIVVVVVYA